MSEPDNWLDKTFEFNREHLRTFVQRLMVLLETVDAKGFEHDDWYANLVLKLVSNVGRVCRKLYETTDQEEALPEAAWNARNLLELWIWIAFCSASRANARRFHEDALRDAKGLADSFCTVLELGGIQNDLRAKTKQHLDAVALKEQIKSLDAKYLKVSDAAKLVDMDKVYNSHRTFLSKLAHPTAGLVIGMMPSPEKALGFQSTCTTLGVNYANECANALERMVSELYSRPDAETKTSAARGAQ